MLSDKEKEELQELINLLYNGHISQYGKRKLEKYIKKQSKEIERINEILTWKQKHEEQLQKEIEELKDKYSDEKIRNTVIKRYREVIEKDYISKDKIKAKIEEVQNMKAKAKDIVFKSSLNYIETELESLLEKKE